MLHLPELNRLTATDHPYPANRFAGRGIVIGAGGAKYFGCAWQCVHVLRALGCTLPVEFWYLDRHELDPEMAHAAEAVGITCINARALGRSLDTPPRILNGWELKPFSVIHSAFEEVLYLDADQLPVRDPTFLFDHQEYQRTGAIFWPDLPPFDRPEWLPPVVWHNVGLEYRNSIDFESGQLLIDKRRCWRELALTWYMNDHSDYFYQFVFGDKSTWHLAWVKCGTPFAMPGFAAGWIHPAIIQHDFAGQPLFQHCCQGKDDLIDGRAVRHLKSWHLNHAAIADLHTRWSGNIFDWAAQTPAETSLAAELVGPWDYHRHGLGSRTLELLADGRIGQGAAACEKRWSLRFIPPLPLGEGRGEGAPVPTVIIVGEAHKASEIAMMFLTPRPRDLFPDPDQPATLHGHWTEFERGEVTLTKLPLHV